MGVRTNAGARIDKSYLAAEFTPKAFDQYEAENPVRNLVAGPRWLTSLRTEIYLFLIRLQSLINSLKEY
jgi:hypothetical protein